MKKIILAASLLLGITGMSFAQTSLAKNNTTKPSGKMTISKNQTASKPVTGATQVAKTTGTQKSSPAVKANNKPVTTKTSSNTIGKHPKKNKTAKKAQKAKKKASKSKVGKKE